MKAHTDCEPRPIRGRSNAVLSIVVRAIKCETNCRDLAGFYFCSCFGGWECENDAENGGEESEGEFHLDEVFWTWCE